MAGLVLVPPINQNNSAHVSNGFTVRMPFQEQTHLFPPKPWSLMGQLLSPFYR